MSFDGNNLVQFHYKNFYIHVNNSCTYKWPPLFTCEFSAEYTNAILGKALKRCTLFIYYVLCLRICSIGKLITSDGTYLTGIVTTQVIFTKSMRFMEMLHKTQHMYLWVTYNFYSWHFSLRHMPVMICPNIQSGP